MAKKLVAVFALAAMLFSLAALGFAQESTVKGNLAVTVSDPSGAVVSGATVTATGPTGERSLQTDAEGRALFQVLIPGYYSVRGINTWNNARPSASVWSDLSPVGPV